MKKKLLVICALLMALLLTGCGGGESIDGVWQSKDTEYEFADGYGRRIDYIDGNITDAESFTYTLMGDTMTMVLADGAERQCTWSVSGKN